MSSLSELDVVKGKIMKLDTVLGLLSQKSLRIKELEANCKKIYDDYKNECMRSEARRKELECNKENYKSLVDRQHKTESKLNGIEYDYKCIIEERTEKYETLQRQFAEKCASYEALKQRHDQQLRKTRSIRHQYVQTLSDRATKSSQTYNPGDYHPACVKIQTQIYDSHVGMVEEVSKVETSITGTQTDLEVSNAATQTTPVKETIHRARMTVNEAVNVLKRSKAEVVINGGKLLKYRKFSTEIHNEERMMDKLFERLVDYVDSALTKRPKRRIKQKTLLLKRMFERGSDSESVISSEVMETKRDFERCSLDLDSGYVQSDLETLASHRRDEYDDNICLYTIFKEMKVPECVGLIDDVLFNRYIEKQTIQCEDSDVNRGVVNNKPKKLALTDRRLQTIQKRLVNVNKNRVNVSKTESSTKGGVKTLRASPDVFAVKEESATKTLQLRKRTISVSKTIPTRNKRRRSDSSTSTNLDENDVKEEQAIKSTANDDNLTQSQAEIPNPSKRIQKASQKLNTTAIVKSTILVDKICANPIAIIRNKRQKSPIKRLGVKTQLEGTNLDEKIDVKEQQTASILDNLTKSIEIDNNLMQSRLDTENLVEMIRSKRQKLDTVKSHPESDAKIDGKQPVVSIFDEILVEQRLQSTNLSECTAEKPQNLGGKIHANQQQTPSNLDNLTKNTESKLDSTNPSQLERSSLVDSIAANQKQAPNGLDNSTIKTASNENLIQSQLETTNQSTIIQNKQQELDTKLVDDVLETTNSVEKIVAKEENTITNENLIQSQLKTANLPPIIQEKQQELNTKSVDNVQSQLKTVNVVENIVVNHQEASGNFANSTNNNTVTNEEQSQLETANLPSIIKKELDIKVVNPSSAEVDSKSIQSQAENVVLPPIIQFDDLELKTESVHVQFQLETTTNPVERIAPSVLNNLPKSIEINANLTQSQLDSTKQQQQQSKIKSCDSNNKLDDEATKAIAFSDTSSTTSNLPKRNISNFDDCFGDCNELTEIEEFGVEKVNVRKVTINLDKPQKAIAARKQNNIFQFSDDTSSTACKLPKRKITNFDDCFGNCNELTEIEEFGVEKPRNQPLPRKQQPTIKWVTARKIFRRLEHLQDSQETFNHAITTLSRIDRTTLIMYMLNILVQDRGEAQKGENPFEPPLTLTQKVQIGVLVRLEENGDNSVIGTFADACEKQLLFKQKDAEIVSNLARIFAAICRLKHWKHRLRKLICDGLYFMDNYAMPMIFHILLSCLEVLKIGSSDDDPLSMVLIQHLYTHNEPDCRYYQVSLKNLLKNYYKYPTERYDENKLMKEFLTSYFAHMDVKYELAILILCKINKPDWVLKQIQLIIELMHILKTQDIIEALFRLIGKIRRPLSNPQRKKVDSLLNPVVTALAHYNLKELRNQFPK